MANSTVPQRSLRGIHWNAEGVNSKKADLIQILNRYRIDIALTNEIMLKPQPSFRLPGYKIVRTDRNATTGGRTAIAVINIKYQQLLVPQLESMESTSIQIYIREGPLIV